MAKAKTKEQLEQELAAALAQVEEVQAAYMKAITPKAAKYKPTKLVTFTHAVMTELCSYIAGGPGVRGMTVTDATNQPGMPSMSLLFTWLDKAAAPEEYPEFKGVAEMYAAALEVRLQSMQDECVQIADDDRISLIEETEQELVYRRGKLVIDPETGKPKIRITKQKIKRIDNTQRATLQITTRQWIMGRMTPKKVRVSQMDYRISQGSATNQEGADDPALIRIISGLPAVAQIREVPKVTYLEQAEDGVNRDA